MQKNLVRIACNIFKLQLWEKLPTSEMISSESTRIGDQFNVLATESVELEAEYNCAMEHSV